MTRKDARWIRTTRFVSIAAVLGLAWFGSPRARGDEPLRWGCGIWGGQGTTSFQPAAGEDPSTPPDKRRYAGPIGSEDLTLGFTGRPGYRPIDLSGSDYIPIDDRWRLGFPQWDRYVYGRWHDPYNQNVLKGDYPLWQHHGKDVFLVFTGVSDTLLEAKRVPVAGGADEQLKFQHNLVMTFDLFQGDNTLHPSEWLVRITPVYNYVAQTDKEGADDLTIQEGFIDLQLAIVSEYYDAINIRVGRQGFISDFRGFLFADVNDAVRLFGNYEANRTQWNAFVFDQVKKDGTSNLNTFEDREQIVAGVNIIRQDFIFQGFNVLAAAVYDHDDAKEGLEAVYLEVAGDGHIGRFLVTAAFIQAFGSDELNPISKRKENINGQFAALELQYQIDWFFPKVSVLFASGDSNPEDGDANGFDGIFDNPNFAGAAFSYLQRNAINVGGVQLSNTFSFFPNLRTKANDPANFVNPGLFLVNTGFNANMTTRLFATFNANYYRIIDPAAIELKSGKDVGRELGFETNLGIVYKPLIIDNLVIQVGASAFWPGSTIKDLSGDSDALYTTFIAITAVY